MFGRFGWAEILVIVVLIVILFGHNKIPGVMKNLADGLNVFKRELKAEEKPAAPVSDKPAAKPAAKKPVAKKKSVAKKVTVKKTTAKKAVKK